VAGRAQAEHERAQQQDDDVELHAQAGAQRAERRTAVAQTA